MLCPGSWALLALRAEIGWDAAPRKKKGEIFVFAPSAYDAVPGTARDFEVVGKTGPSQPLPTVHAHRWYRRTSENESPLWSFLCKRDINDDQESIDPSLYSTTKDSNSLS